MLQNPVLQNSEAFCNKKFFKFGPSWNEITYFLIVFFVNDRQFTIGQCLYVVPCGLLEDKTSQVHDEITFGGDPLGHFPVVNKDILPNNAGLHKPEPVRFISGSQEVISPGK